ncbi:MAG TPA: hypothetical protein PL010_12250 [Flavobacteriales bacterium]|nr:hypothetical protein [Flavobacteriales bacterium]HNI05386.1 hypothetical protein [Flavobacteriales bacterium]HNK69846.1 hypothetical protein [Flavobacteriales bacterium]HNO06900.1 hypothetical protein [Flavobacteriales bacterium]
MSTGATIKSSTTKGATDAMKKVIGHWAFWMVLAVLVLIIAWKLKGKVGQWWTNLWKEDRTAPNDYTPNAEDIARVKGIAQDLYTGIHSAYASGREEAINQALGLTATDLKFLAEEYKALSGGTSLIEDLEGEWTAGDEADRLIARLNEAGVPKSMNAKREEYQEQPPIE